MSVKVNIWICESMLITDVRYGTVCCRVLALALEEEDRCECG